MDVRKISEFLTNNKFFSKLGQLMEYDGVNMSLTSLLLSLYGATIIPRVIQAYDEYDRKEILTRDCTSITLIMFGSRALKKIISKISSGNTGIALSKSEGCTTVDYLKPFGGVQVLTSPEIKNIYSNPNREQKGLLKIFDFLDKNGGDTVKFLSFDETVKKASETVLGKPISKETTADVVKAAFDKAHSATEGAVKDALDTVYNSLKKPDNVFVKKGKSVNGVFDFVSTLVAVPALMIGIQFFNQYQTQKHIAEKAAKLKASQKPGDKTVVGKTTDKPSVSEKPAVTDKPFAARVQTSNPLRV